MKVPPNRWLAVGIAVPVFVAAWLLLTPPGRFGLCRFAVTVYGSRPYLLRDLQIRPDGVLRTTGKTHDIQAATVGWLLEARPAVLIIATGWHGVGKVATRRAIPELRKAGPSRESASIPSERCYFPA